MASVRYRLGLEVVSVCALIAACGSDDGTKKVLPATGGSAGAPNAGGSSSGKGGSAGKGGNAGTQSGAGEGGETASGGSSGSGEGGAAGEGGSTGSVGCNMGGTNSFGTTIDASGDTLELSDGMSLTVPAGALDDPTGVCIEVDPAESPERDEFAVGSVYAIEPHGLEFSSAATVRLPISRGSALEDASSDPSITGTPQRVIMAEAGGAWASVAGSTLANDGGSDFVEAPTSALSYWSVSCAWKTIFRPRLRVFALANPETIVEVSSEGGQYEVAPGAQVHVVLEAGYSTTFNPRDYPGHAPIEGTTGTLAGWSLDAGWSMTSAGGSPAPIAGTSASTLRTALKAVLDIDGVTIGAALDWNRVAPRSHACFEYQGIDEPLTAQLSVTGSPRAGIAAGGSVSFAIATDGTVYAWGSNAAGSLGDGTTNPAPSPIPIPSLEGAVQISTRGNHSLALMPDGTVLAWGDNDYGQLGDGSTNQRSTPDVVPDLANVQSISAGFDSSFALKEDGTVWAWGSNWHGEMGVPPPPTHDGSEPNPVQIQGLPACVSVQASGGYNATALGIDGTVWTWGDNQFSQLGDGTQNERSTPDTVSGLPTPRAIIGGAGRVFVIDSNALLWMWGIIEAGAAFQGSPILVPGMTNTAAAVSAADRFVFLDGNGQVHNWSTLLAENVTTVPVLSAIVQVATSTTHSVALKSDGTVWTWGDDANHQLGDGPSTRANPDTPEAISGFDLDGP